MSDMNAFERQVAGEVLRSVGPIRPVDDLAVYDAVNAVSQSHEWRFQTMFSATKLIVAGALVALFGGFLLAGMLPPSPDREAAPGAVATAEPASSAAPSPSVPSDSSTDVAESPGQVYEATARLIVDPGPNASFQDVGLAQDALIRYARQADSRVVAQAVIDELGLDESPASLLERISTTTSGDTLLLSIEVRDEDPEAARLLAFALGEEMRQRVRDVLITAEVKGADAAIAANKRAIKISQRRLDNLRKKPNKNAAERNEIIALTGQISNLQRDIQFLQPGSIAFVRNRLDWFERPVTPEQVDPGGWQEAVVPTIGVVVANQRIEQGTSIESEMLTLRTVPMDATNEMAFTDRGSALGRVAAIDILVNQIISPNMLVAE